MTREEVLKVVYLLTLTIQLMESEIFSEVLFPKNVFLKVDEAVSGSHSENVFPRLEEFTYLKPIHQKHLKGKEDASSFQLSFLVEKKPSQRFW